MTTRSVVQRGLGWLAGAVVLVVLGFLVGHLYAVRRLDAARRAFTRDIGPTSLSAWAPPRVPEAENAAIPIRAGVLGLVLSQSDRTLVGDLAVQSREPLAPEHVVRLRLILKRHDAALELLRRGATLERASFDVEPHAGAPSRERVLSTGIMTASRLLCAQARLARLDGDRETMLQALETLSGVARAVHQEPRVESQIVSHAAERLLLGAVTEVATAAETTAGELRRMQGMVLDSDLGAAWRRTNGVDFAQTLAAIEGAQARAAREPEPNWVERAMSRIVEPLIEAQSFESAVELAALLGRPLGAHWPEVEARWVNARVTPLNVFRAMKGSTLVHVAGRFQATASQRRLVGLGLALRLRGLTEGTYPADLGAFPAAGGPDPFTGKPFSYLRHPDGSAVLAVPEGDALWKQVTGGMPDPCPFAWSLPAPAPPVPGAQGA